MRTKIFCLLLMLGGLANLQAAQLGTASYYGAECAGKKTASGAIFDPAKLTCASWRYPFGTRLRVTNIANGKTVLVTVNDRGPHKRLGRAIDLSEAAFKRIADCKLGLIRVKIEKVK